MLHLWLLLRPGPKGAVSAVEVINIGVSAALEGAQKNTCSTSVKPKKIQR
jgi:hypothetical protein